MLAASYETEKNDTCGQSMSKSDLAECSGVFYASDVDTADGLSLHVCAPYGTYGLELKLFADGTMPVSGEIDWKIYQGLCEVSVGSAH